ncbi:ferritin-like domain-containing protein [Paraliomyxa miuraensis]|nr:ferritin-like domain-containing protein [Paraliomyxa miuraensis]
MNYSTSPLRQRIMAIVGLALLAPSCADDVVHEDGSGSASATSGPTSEPTASEPTASASDPFPTDESPDCGASVSRVVCVPPPGQDGSTGDGTDTGDSVGDATSTGDPGTGSEGTASGGTGDASTGGGSGTGSESTGSGDTGGMTEPVSCEGAMPDDYSFCVYEMGEIFEQDGQCCRLLEGTENCCDGRPFIVGEVARIAPTIDRADWCGAVAGPRLDGLDPRARAELAAAWQADASMEHASIASFARFILHLLALGAPPELVAEAQRALADEIEHARQCFALASAYGGRPVGPGPLAVHDALDGPVTLVTAAVAAVREGCIGETMAAYQAEVAAARATDPAVRAVLSAIAEDEARHAALAWRFVTWALAQGDAAVEDAVRQAFEEHGADAALDDRPAPIDPAIWRAHGRLSSREIGQTLRRGRREIVGPCARALLAASRGYASRAAESVVSIA